MPVLLRLFSVKQKVNKIFLCLTKYHVMNTYWRVEVYFHTLTSARDGTDGRLHALATPSPAPTRQEAAWASDPPGLAVAKRSFKTEKSFSSPVDLKIVTYHSGAIYWWNYSTML
jgi:hypothetical protein